MLIDPFRFARKRDQLERCFHLEAKSRLQGIITGNSDINLKLFGNKSEEGRLVLDGQIEGIACVQCQVCLDNIKMPLDFQFRLYPVSSEQEAEKLQQELEPVIVENNSLVLIDLVINELILSMPAITSHINIEGNTCIDESRLSSGTLPEESREEINSSPFAILNTIKQKND